MTLRKHLITLAACAAMAGCGCMPVRSQEVPAILPDPTPEVIIIKRIELVPTPTPTPAVRMPAREYEWSEEDLRELASVYWAETGANNARTEREKQAITQLVWNRARHGDPFPGTIAEVCRQRGEFNRGHISNRNIDNARLYLNRVQTQADGDYQGITVPRSALYMARDGEGGALCLYDSSWVIVWRSDIDE